MPRRTLRSGAGRRAEGESLMDERARKMIPLVGQLARSLAETTPEFFEALGVIEPAFARKAGHGDSAGDRDALNEQAALGLAAALAQADMLVGRRSWPTADRWSVVAGRERPVLSALLSAFERLTDSDKRLADRVRDWTNEAAQASGSTSAGCSDRPTDAGQRARAQIEFFESLVRHGCPAIRRQMGVYFTPRPVVDFMIRSATKLTASLLSLPSGRFADPSDLCYLDPACGSGAFVTGLLDAHIQAHRAGRGASPGRILAIDMLPACCLSLRLALEADQEAASSRAGKVTACPVTIGCTNALNDPSLIESALLDRIPVIIGNPPYGTFGRKSSGSWIRKQVEDYRIALNERKTNLQDDFIKFMRWGQYWIERSGRGILAYVTSHTFLRGVTHRRMRQSLASTFDECYFLDLGGNWKRRRNTHDSVADENVFPIQQGVAISLLVKHGLSSRSSERVWFGRLSGTREQKYQRLEAADVSSFPWQSVRLQAPKYAFTVQEVVSREYSEWPALNDVFRQKISGVQTKRDALFVDFHANQLQTRIASFLRRERSKKLNHDTPQWLHRKVLRTNPSLDPSLVRPYLVAPFDVRWVYYDPRLLGRARQGIMSQVGPGNRALVFMRQSTNGGVYDHFLVTNMLVSDRAFYSAHGTAFVAPLAVTADNVLQPNFSRSFLECLEDRSECASRSSEDRTCDAASSQDVFHWLYATVCCSRYRRGFGAMMRSEFPRIPWPKDPRSFTMLAQLGRELADAQLGALTAQCDLTKTLIDDRATAIPIKSGYPQWSADERLRLNDRFRWSVPVSRDAWQYRIGGYRVLPRWLDQRRKKFGFLNSHQLDELEAVVGALHRTIELVKRIDQCWDQAPA